MRGVFAVGDRGGRAFVLRLEQSLSRSATAPFTQGSLLIGANAPEVSPSATGRGMSHARRAGRASRRRGRVYFFCQARQKKIPKRTRLKGYANREGYALIYLDIAQLFFFPKQTIRLHFYSRSALKEGCVRTSRADVGRERVVGRGLAPAAFFMTNIPSTYVSQHRRIAFSRRRRSETVEPQRLWLAHRK